MKFLHLSDLHIHTHHKDNENAASMFAFISKMYPDHRLIVTGDIADDGKVEQFENAFTFLQPFKGRVFVCPGNHDFGAVGNFYSYERALNFDRIIAEQLNQGGTFTGDSTPVVSMLQEGATKVMLIALDSNLETESPFDFACGEIGESQLAALNTILTTTGDPAIIKVLFFHHHPFMHNDPFMEMKDARALAKVIYGRVNVVLFGHKHEMREWKKVWGTEYVLASDDSPGKDYAKEITIDQTGISVQPLPIARPRRGRKG